MKKVVKVLSSICALVALVPLASGCTWINESSEKVKDYAKTFFEYIAEDNYEEAKSLLHPDSSPKKDKLEAYIASQEALCGVDFSDGVVLKSGKNFSYSMYTSEVDGSLYEVTYAVLVGTVEAELFISVVENDEGEGIYVFAFAD